MSFGSLAVILHIQKEVIQTLLLSFGSPGIIRGFLAEFLFTMMSQHSDTDGEFFLFPRKN